MGHIRLAAAAGFCLFATATAASDQFDQPASPGDLVTVCVKPDTEVYVSYGCRFVHNERRCHCNAPARPVMVEICNPHEASALRDRAASDLRKASLATGTLVDERLNGRRLCLSHMAFPPYLPIGETGVPYQVPQQ
jgi:hypothetical protein